MENRFILKIPLNPPLPKGEDTWKVPHQVRNDGDGSPEQATGDIEINKICCPFIVGLKESVIVERCPRG